MQNDPIDLLQIKIEKAREGLSRETRQAIDAVPWKVVILEMRTSKGYNFEQLGDLETETELLLCGLLSGEDYPKELEKRMRIPRAQVDVLVNEMNELVFKKIREELVKITERNKVNPFNLPLSEETKSPPLTREGLRENFEKKENEILKKAGIEINKTLELMPPEKKIEQREDMLKKVENPNLITAHPILTQKLSGSFQTPTVKTEYSLNNISKTPPSPSPDREWLRRGEIPSVDPYRETPQ